MFGSPLFLNGKYTYTVPASYSYLFGSMTAKTPLERQRFAVTDLNGELDNSVSIGSGFTIASPTTTVSQIGLDFDSTGKYYVTGGATGYNGINITTLAGSYVRLNTDGTLDTTFYGGVNNATIYSKVASDGKVYLYGNFTTLTGTSASGPISGSPQRIVRLNSNGTLDGGFSVGSGPAAVVRDLQFQSDGKLVIVGNFTGYAGSTVTRAIRLNTNGIRDTSFTAASINAEVTSASIDSSGKIYIAGAFTGGRIRRMNADGSTDTAFVVGSGFNGNVNKVLAVSDKVYVGGSFFSYNGVSARGLTRLNSDGSIDTGFNIGTGIGGTISTGFNQVRDIIQVGSNILVVGDFNYYNDVYVPGAVLLDSTGAIVNTFTGDCYPQGIVKVVNNTVSNKLSFVGSFKNFGVPENRGLSVTNQDGTIQTTPNFIGKFGSWNFSSTALIGPVVKNTNTGGYWVINNSNNPYYQLNVLYSVIKTDSDFNPIPGWINEINLGNTVNSVLHDSIDGGYYAVGGFTGIANRIYKANSDGTQNAEFFTNRGTGFSTSPSRIINFAGGVLICSTSAGTYNTSTTFPRIIKLNSNGTVDTSFVMGTGFNAEVRDIQLDPNTGSVYCIGSFTTYNGNAAPGIVKLLPNGSIDTSFAFGLGFQGGSPRSMAVLSNGDLYVIGSQSSYNDISVPAMFKLKANGTVDTTFNITEGNVTSSIITTSALTLVENNKVIYMAPSNNITYKGNVYYNAVKINPDSSVDTSFTFPYDNAYNITFLN